MPFICSLVLLVLTLGCSPTLNATCNGSACISAPNASHDSTQTQRSPDFSISSNSNTSSLPQPPSPPPAVKCASQPPANSVGYQAMVYQIYSVYKRYGRSCVDVEGLNYWSGLLHADLNLAYSNNKVLNLTTSEVASFYLNWRYAGPTGPFESQLR